MRRIVKFDSYDSLAGNVQRFGHFGYLCTLVTFHLNFQQCYLRNCKNAQTFKLEDGVSMLTLLSPGLLTAIRANHKSKLQRRKGNVVGKKMRNLVFDMTGELLLLMALLNRIDVATLSPGGGFGEQS